VGFDENLLSNEEIKKHYLNIITWKEENEIRDILNFDIGIMPLHNDPWSQGKCGFKLIQYMSCKKAVIASPVGVNREIVQKENGFLANSLDEWYNSFEILYNDKILRDKIALNNFKKIELEYNYNANCKKYINLIDKLLSKKETKC